MNSKFHTVRGYELINEGSENLTSALEDYLEMIYRNSLTEPSIRVKELAQLLNVKDCSASKMVKKLGQLNLVNYEKYGMITLTSEGEVLGQYLYERHAVIEQFLKSIGVTEQVLEQTELMEHILLDKTYEGFELLNQFFIENPTIYEIYLNYKRSKT